ncbi:hypothetical protein B0H19DRAFT_1112483 [Mycena capillaripes]|nr:hypothetical protein B0H19DRAFT_1112483 [Mycena capillaripes]
MRVSRCSKCGELPTSAILAEEAFVVGPAPGTRHHTLLNSNEPLAEDPDLVLIQSVISETDERLACLDDEIARMKDQLKQLERARASLASYRARNIAINSALKKIPPEVLGEIFFGTLPSITDELNRGKVDMGVSPWLLAQISSRWRAVSLATPSLWSRMVIEFSPRGMLHTHIHCLRSARSSRFDFN